MEFVTTDLPGVLRIRPKIFGDHRGDFSELYHAEKYARNGLDVPFVQDNLSRSQQGVLRGLHYQLEQPQGKLVTCLHGEIFDVAVDLRRSSPTFGQWLAVNLTGETRESLYIPPGFAHGFYVLSQTATVFYKCTSLYHPGSERTLLWSDEAIGIRWPLHGDPQLADKDKQGVPLSAAECFA